MKIHIGPYTYEVITQLEKMDRIRAQTASPGAFGACTPTEEEIVICPDESPMVQKSTLIHESIHAIWAASGLKYADKTEFSEEDVASYLGGPLLDLLRRNPDLVEYLMEGTGWMNEINALRKRKKK